LRARTDAGGENYGRAGKRCIQPLAGESKRAIVDSQGALRERAGLRGELDLKSNGLAGPNLQRRLQADGSAERAPGNSHARDGDTAAI
jgi:hypothetical protein